MSYAITYTVGASTFNLNGYDAATGLTFGYLGDQGFGLAPMHRITQRGPMQNGDSDVDFRLDPRIMQVPLFVATTSIDEYYTARGRLLEVFSPTNGGGVVTVTTSAWTRSINVKVLGGMSFDTDPQVGYALRAVIQLRADDPTWYDAYGYEATLTSPILGTPTPYPKPNEVPYGSAGIGGITNILYEGTWICYPVLTAVGPLTDLTITDGLGHVISIDTPIPASTYISIDLKYGAKTVVDQDGVNRFAWLDINSDLTNWALYPSPFVVGGINTISVSATGTDGDSSVSINWLPRYIGV